MEIHGFTPERERVLERMRKRLVRQDNRDAINRVRQDHHVWLRREPQSYMRLVDMRGPDDCWPWLGTRHWNHSDETTRLRFEQGGFSLGDRNEMATHVMCFLAYDRIVPDEIDITPTCYDHLCCNPRHFLVTPHGTPREDKHLYGEPAGKWLCENVREVAK